MTTIVALDANNERSPIWCSKFLLLISDLIIVLNIIAVAAMATISIEDDGDSVNQNI